MHKTEEPKKPNETGRTVSKISIRFGFDFYFSQTEVSVSVLILVSVLVLVSVSSMYAPNWPKPNQIIYNIFYIIILYI